MPKTITVELTEAEAWALWQAAGNSIGDAAGWDDAMSVLGHASKVRAGWRALDKLRRELRPRVRVK